MEQLGLALSARLPYDSNNFLLHQGVRECALRCEELLRADKFQIGFIRGARRAGKTHFSIRLGARAVELGRLPRSIDGYRLGEWLAGSFADVRWTPRDVLIIDDAHEYFRRIQPGGSGPFVHMIEAMRALGAAVFLLSQEPLHAFACDDHVKSRLRPGDGLEISAPDDRDIEELVTFMAAQRGIHLKDRQTAFVARRIGRSIPAIEAYFDRVLHLSQLFGRKIQYPVLGDAV